MKYEELKIIAISSNGKIEKSDAIVCLEGDGQIRTKKALKLFKDKLAPIIIVSGGVGGSSFAIPANKMANFLIKNGVSRKNIIIEEKSQNTHEQAEAVMKIIKKNGWKKIILVASAFHQSRAYLTFLKSMLDNRIKIKIFNSPTKDLWFEKTKLGLSRLELLIEEFKKIKAYQKKGHILSIDEALEYQKWKEG